MIGALRTQTARLRPCAIAAAIAIATHVSGQVASAQSEPFSSEIPDIRIEDPGFEPFPLPPPPPDAAPPAELAVPSPPPPVPSRVLDPGEGPPDVPFLTDLPPAPTGDAPAPTPRRASDIVIREGSTPIVPEGETIGQLPDRVGYRVLFAGGSADLTQAAGMLLDGLAVRMRVDPTIRVQIRAYATEAAGGESAARRLALARGLTIRDLLVDRGASPTSVEVRALGQPGAGPPDRADLILSTF